MNIALWIGAALLALGFLASGTAKLTQPRDKLIASGWGWVGDFSRLQITLIGIAEVLGAVGLILPSAAGILPVLSPVAAVGLALVMAGAVIVHRRRAERGEMAAPVVLAVLTTALAVFRFGPYPY